MHASRIYVTGLVPCLVNVADFPLYKLQVFRAEVSSYLSSLHTLELHIQAHQLCTNKKKTSTWIHHWVDLAEKLKRICSALITSSLPSFVNMHQYVL